MLGILRLLAGPKLCPWCLPPRDGSMGDRITDRLPIGVAMALSRYDGLVGRVAIPVHGWLHEGVTSP